MLTAKNRTRYIFDTSNFYCQYIPTTTKSQSTDGAVRKEMDPIKTLDDRHQPNISTEIRSHREYIDSKKSYNANDLSAVRFQSEWGDIDLWFGIVF